MLSTILSLNPYWSIVNHIKPKNSFFIMNGVYSDKNILGMIAKGDIRSSGIEKRVQSSSLDLTLGKKGWIMKGSATPLRGETMQTFLDRFAEEEISLKKSFTLERHIFYVFELAEEFKIHEQLRISSNTKSSNGRIDLQSRLLSPGNPQYDLIQGAYTGKLYLEVISKSFVPVLRAGDPINQIRFAEGNPAVSDDELRTTSLITPILFDAAGNKLELQSEHLDNGLVFTVDLESDIVGYVAKDTNKKIDLQNTTTQKLHDYFTPISKPKDGRLSLVPGQFYLLSTRERIAIPPNYAGEMAPFDPKAGNLTVHYAGFFDAGFGYPNGNNGTLEVRVHSPAILQHGQRLGMIRFERMLSVPNTLYGKGSNYKVQQGVKPAKYFVVE